MSLGFPLEALDFRCTPYSGAWPHMLVELVPEQVVCRRWVGVPVDMVEDRALAVGMRPVGAEVPVLSGTVVKGSC